MKKPSKPKPTRKLDDDQSEYLRSPRRTDNRSEQDLWRYFKDHYDGERL